MKKKKRRKLDRLMDMIERQAKHKKRKRISYYNSLVRVAVGEGLKKQYPVDKDN